MNHRKLRLEPLYRLGAAILRALGLAYAVEPRNVVLERVAVTVPGLPPHLDGFRIGLLTDLHMGPFTTAPEVRALAGMLAAEKPDLCLLGGDFVSAREAADGLDEALEPVRGAYGVLGNWDYGSRAVARLRQHSMVRILVNEGVEAAPGLWLAGVDDLRRGRPDIGRALAGAPEGAVRILLSHEPDLAVQVRPEHRLALQISGHSHGGQVRLPLVGPVLLPPGGRRYPAGLAEGPSCPVYTSRGIGMSHLPIRFGCPPEITIITLRRG